MKIRTPKHATVIAYAALFFAMGGTAVAATGSSFITGRANAATTTTTLTNSAGIPLTLNARSGSAPLAVNSTTKVGRLNSDLLDGLDSSLLQRRVTGVCGAGSAVSGVTATGTVTCAPIPAATDTSGLQKRVNGTCAGGYAMTGVAADGSVTCAPFPTATDTSGLQKRVNGTCPSGYAMTGVAADGTVSCTQLTPSPVATGPAQFRDKGFAISDLQISPDSIGDWDAVGRITNETSEARTGTFTITVFRSGTIVTTLRGSVSSLAPGNTNTVNFFSTDDYTAGEYTTTFQTDSAFTG